jgi:nitroreductase
VEFNEVIKRRRMVHAFTAEPLAPGTADRLLWAANRAPSTGFSQGYSFLVLEGKEEAAPFWQLLYEQTLTGLAVLHIGTSPPIDVTGHPAAMLAWLSGRSDGSSSDADGSALPALPPLA